MTKSDISNFQEFCKLRNEYAKIAMMPRPNEFEFPAHLLEYLKTELGVGFHHTCTLCNATSDQLEDPSCYDCDKCMWILHEKSTGENSCLTDTYMSRHPLHTNKCTIELLAQRINEMDQLIEAYYNLEE